MGRFGPSTLLIRLKSLSSFIPNCVSFKRRLILASAPYPFHLSFVQILLEIDIHYICVVCSHLLEKRRYNGGGWLFEHYFPIVGLLLILNDFMRLLATDTGLMRRDPRLKEWFPRYVERFLKAILKISGFRFLGGRDTLIRLKWFVWWRYIWDVFNFLYFGIWHLLKGLSFFVRVSRGIFQNETRRFLHFFCRKVLLNDILWKSVISLVLKNRFEIDNMLVDGLFRKQRLTGLGFESAWLLRTHFLYHLIWIYHRFRVLLKDVTCLSIVVT